ncbi:MAG: hypothetical protein VST70_06225 [Nitrospirota bacterium]|nr:hypothetical protein [Nitrospirota bacterium]
MTTIFFPALIIGGGQYTLRKTENINGLFLALKFSESPASLRLIVHVIGAIRSRLNLSREKSSANQLIPPLGQDLEKEYNSDQKNYCGFKVLLFISLLPKPLYGQDGLGA